MPTKTVGTAAEPAAPGGSARERLLAAANELFYREGIHTVGIDRVIERAGVAKASLYNTFGSKDELIRAYLQERHARTAGRIGAAMERYSTPREKLLAIFESQADYFTSSEFRGCAFMNASAETQPGSSIEQVSDEYRGWIRALFTGLAEQAGAPDPAALAGRLVVLYDGAGLSARMDRNPGVFADVRVMAAALIDSALAGG
ncbi:TetR/AcrR family transcriptional regulator [Jatrophihabitans sp.]|uniref:TetR/AcrR family transcriptional regulator n=1 Tax=Jatrophihabitans sp. TaxID=1932789 RepID=UPI0030C71FE1|nr:regulatory protein TetR [Jatrophihabitans sp.]